MYETPENPSADNTYQGHDDTPFSDDADTFVETPAGTVEDIEESSSRIPRSTIAMALLFAAGVAIIWVLSANTTPQMASASDKEVEKQVDTFLEHSRAKQIDPLNTDGTDLVDRLNNYAARRQVPLEMLNTNPFARAEAAPAEDGVPAIRRTAGNARRRADLQVECGRMKLRAVMISERGATAIIDNQLVMVSGKIGSFVVSSITSDRVELTCEKMTFTVYVQR